MTLAHDVALRQIEQHDEAWGLRRQLFLPAGADYWNASDEWAQGHYWRVRRVFGDGGPFEASVVDTCGRLYPGFPVVKFSDPRIWRELIGGGEVDQVAFERAKRLAAQSEKARAR